MSKREMPVWRNGMSIKPSEAHEYIAFKPGEILPFISSLLQELEDKEKELESYKKALTPSPETKAIHIGEYKVPVIMFDEEEEAEYTQEFILSWTETKRIMAAIKSHADSFLSESQKGE